MAEKMRRIALGSGALYLSEFTADTVPSVEDLKKTATEIGKIKNGASLEYSKETYTATSDDGTCSKTVITNEKVLLKPGLCTIDSAEVAALVSTARVTTSETQTTVKIGGSTNDNGKVYAVLFYHEDKKDGDIYVLMIAKNTAGLTLEFKKENEVIISPEFTAEAQSDGTLVEIGFVYPTAV